MIATPFKLNMKPPNIICLIVLSAFASMGVALISPALPAISAYFDVLPGHAQLTVTAFLLGNACGNLIYGPLANRFGRKPAFYIGISIATIGSLFSILSSPADSFPLMLFGRILEALGSSAGIVICFTIINDFYYPDQSRKMIGLMSLAFAIMPGIAIMAGGLITEYSIWQMCFYFLLSYGLFLIIPAAALPETTLKYDPNALKGRYLLSGYMAMLRNRKLMAYSFMYGLSAVCLYVFCAEGPMIGIHQLGYSPGTYGLIGLIPYVGAILGSAITINFSKKLTGNQMLKWAIFTEIISAIAIFLFFLFGFVNIETLITPMIIFMVGHAILVSNAAVLAINQTEDKANASAIVNFIAIGTGAVGTLVLGTLHTRSVLILPVIFICTLIIMCFIFKNTDEPENI